MPTGKLPPVANGLQLNFCKTLACRNFGLEDESRYVLQKSNPSMPPMVCKECGAFPPLLSNREVLAEARRQTAEQHLACCTNVKCDNSLRPQPLFPKNYIHFGFSGTKQRYRCKQCDTTFVEPFNPDNPYLTLHIALVDLLIAQQPIREICRQLNLNPKSFYHHLGLIATRCQYLNAVYQFRLMRHHSEYELSCLYSSLQEASHNGVELFTVCDEQSGFIVSQSTNFDPRVMPPDTGSHDPYRPDCQHLPLDAAQQPIGTSINWPEPLLARVDERYRQIMRRRNIEEPLQQRLLTHYPNKASLIRSQYLVYGHLLRLKPYLENREVALYLPQEPLIRSAVISVFKQDVAEGMLHPLYVDQSGQPPNVPSKVDIVLMGWWRDRWAFSQGDDGSKGICHLGGQTGQEEAWLMRARSTQNQRYLANFRAQFSDYLSESRRFKQPTMLIQLSQLYRGIHNLTGDWQSPIVTSGLRQQPLSLAELLSAPEGDI